MIGPRIGTKIGARAGLAIGMGADELAAGRSWTVDATSGKGMPQNATEWAAVLAAAGVSSGGPSSLYLLQEASGNAADTIGGITMTATGGGPNAYQQSVAGWAAKAVEFSEASTGYFKTNSPSLPDPSTTSWARIMYAFVGTNGATSNMYINGTAGYSILARTSGGGGTQWELYDAGATTSADSITDVVRPFVHVRNVPGVAVDAYTDNSHIAGALGVVTGKEVAIGGWSGNPHQFVLYCADFFGTAAQLSTANVRSILQTLGWTVAW